MRQKWYQRASVQTAIASGLFLLLAGIVSGVFLLKSKDKEIEAEKDLNKAVPQLSDVTANTGEHPWEIYIDFTVANLGKRTTTINRLRLVTTQKLTRVTHSDSGLSDEQHANQAIHYQTNEKQFTDGESLVRQVAYMVPSHTYTVPPLPSQSYSNTIEVDLDQFVEIDIPDKFRVKVSVLRTYLRCDIQSVTLFLHPTLETNHGELQGRKLFVEIIKKPPVPLNNREIKELQELLTLLNVDPGPIDGIFGKKTKEAIRKFQESQALHIDGIASRELLDYLRSSAKMKKQ